MAVVNQPTGNPNLLVRPEGYREWSSGLFGCFSDIGSCFCTCCCQACMLCTLARKMDDNCLMPFCALGSLVAMRTKVRTMGGISGTICKDSLAICFCEPCAICQMAREMDNMGL